MSPMNPRLLVPTQPPGILDFAPGAAAAYSLRNLSRSYAGPVVTVRRSSDDAEADFTAAEVSDGTLAAFCGAGDGFVKTWHSQTGSNNATQTTAGYQPKIVSSGSVILEEGKPAIEFDGSDDYLPANGVAAQFSGSGKIISFATVATVDPTNAAGRIIFGIGSFASNVPLIWAGANASDNAVRFDKRGDAVANELNLIGEVPDAMESQSVLFGFADGDSGYVFYNGASAADGEKVFGPLTLNSFAIGVLQRTSNLFYWFGTIQEIIIYPSDLTAQRERIEGNLAWYY